MYPFGLFEYLLGGLFFYLLGKRCQNHNKEYIELDEIQYNNVKDLITPSNGIPPRYDEAVVNQGPGNTTNNQNDLSRYNISTVPTTVNEDYQQPISPPPEFSNDNNPELIRHNEVFVIPEEEQEEQEE